MIKLRLKRTAITLIIIISVLAGCAGGAAPDNSKVSPEDSGNAAIPEDTISESDAPEAVSADDTVIADLIASMTIEEKVGQMFLARCPADGGEDEIAAYNFGGFVMFAANFEDKTPADTFAEIMAYQDVSKIPMLIAVDEEGGTVTRISRFTNYRDSKFLSPRELFAEGGLDLIKSDTVEKCNLLQTLGVNLNLAPVCDIATDPDDFMYDRSLGQDATTTSEYVASVVEIMNEYNIGCSLKHFPGYGPNGDTHTAVITDDRPYETFETTDFLPFIAGINAGAGSVMVSHNIVTCIDPDYPASLSAKMHQLIRDTLGYDGVLITDDLSMDAITLYTDGADAAVAAVEAGNDMLCCSDYASQYAAVLDAVQSGRITEERINESVERILRWKISLGLI